MCFIALIVIPNFTGIYLIILYNHSEGLQKYQLNSTRLDFRVIV